jgi:AcrR family transcriptional regulator
MTMSDVAKRGRIGRATLYRYFASKDELRDAIFLREVNRFMDASTRARASAASVEDALTSSLAITLEFVRDNRMLNRLRETDREMLLEALFDDDLIAMGREFSAQLWKTQLHGEAPVDESAMTHLRTVSEITTRLTLSLIANPQTVVDFTAPGASRAYVQRYLLPLFRPSTNLEQA